MRHISVHARIRKFWATCFPANWSSLLLGLLLLSLMVASVLSAMSGNWGHAFLCLAAFFLALVPFVLAAETPLYLPRIFSMFVALFVYATLYLGEVHRFYYSVWWWDVMLHSGSAFTFGIIALIIMLLAFNKKQLVASPLIVATFVLSFALALGLLWEIFEFTNDQLRGTDMQHVKETGIVDTMKDEIVDVVGASAAAALAYFYVRPGKKTPLDSVIRKTVKKNKRAA